MTCFKFYLFFFSSSCMILVNIANILYGYASGWTSSSLLILESDESPLVEGAMDQEQRSWVTSLFAISGVAGTIIYYFIADFMGRKLPLWSVAVPHGVSIILNTGLESKHWISHEKC